METAAARWLERLSRAYDRIERCHVWVELPHHHSRNATFKIAIVLALPGHELVVSHEPGRSGDHQDVYLALADAFIAARRRLRDFARIRRGEVKAHAA